MGTSAKGFSSFFFFSPESIYKTFSFKVRFQVPHVAVLISYHQPPKYCAIKVIVFLKKKFLKKCN